MLPCFVCGQDAGTGWIKGFPPAPDSQKLALCPMHDTPENRNKVTAAWQYMLEGNLAALVQNEAEKAGDQPRSLTLFFVRGSSVTLPVRSFRMTDDNTLLVQNLDGSKQYFPFQQIRYFAINRLDSHLQDGTLSSSGLNRNSSTADKVSVEGIAVEPDLTPDTTPATGATVAQSIQAVAISAGTGNKMLPELAPTFEAKPKAEFYPVLLDENTLKNYARRLEQLEEHSQQEARNAAPPVTSTNIDTSKASPVTTEQLNTEQ